MTHQWVFGGSQIWVDPDTGEKIYYGDSGELICLSNFSTATMDLTVESSQSDDGLLFEAYTENIPPLGTQVYVMMTPGKRIEAKTEVKPAIIESPKTAAPVNDARPDNVTQSSNHESPLTLDSSATNDSPATESPAADVSKNKSSEPGKRNDK